MIFFSLAHIFLLFNSSSLGYFGLFVCVCWLVGRGYMKIVCGHCECICVLVVGILWGVWVCLFCKLLIYRKIIVKIFGGMEIVLYLCNTIKEIRVVT